MQSLWKGLQQSRFEFYLYFLLNINLWGTGLQLFKNTCNELKTSVDNILCNVCLLNVIHYWVTSQSCNMWKYFVNWCDADILLYQLIVKGYIFTVLCTHCVFWCLPVLVTVLLSVHVQKKCLFVSEQSACPVTWEHTRCTSVECHDVIR